MKTNRVLGLTLALDTTRLGKGINIAMRSLNGIEGQARSVSRRLNSTLGKTLASSLPKDIKRMRLAVREEGIRLAQDQKRLDKELFDNRVRRDGLRRQMSDLRNVAAERNRIHNENVKRERLAYKLETEQNQGRQRALRQQVRQKELALQELDKAGQNHIIRGTRLQMQGERFAYNQTQHRLRQQHKLQSMEVDRLFSAQQGDLLKVKGAKSDALRKAQSTLVDESALARIQKAQNISDLQTQRHALNKLAQEVSTKQKAYDSFQQSGGVSPKMLADLEATKKAHADAQKIYQDRVVSARKFNKDWTGKKVDLEADVRTKQAELRASAGATRFDVPLRNAILEQQNTASKLTSNRIKFQSEELRKQNDILLPQLKAKHGIESREAKVLGDILDLKGRILKGDIAQSKLDASQSKTQFKHGLTAQEHAKLGSIRSGLDGLQQERSLLEVRKSKMYDRRLSLGEGRERLRMAEVNLLNQQEVGYQMQQVFGMVSQLATAALTTGFGLVFTADYFRRHFINPALQRFSEFETELTRYRSISGIDLKKQSSADSYREDLQLIRQISLKSGYSNTETTRALSNLISAGLDPEVSRKMLPSVLDVTQASYGEITPDAAGKIMATIFQKFDLFKYGDIEQQSKYMADWVFQLKQASKLEFSEVEGFMSSLQAAPAVLRMDTSDIGALGTALMRLGASPRNAAQQINALSPNIARIVRRLSDEVKVKGFGGKLIEQQNELGYNLSGKDFFNEDKTLKGGWDILKAIYDGYQRSKLTEGEGPAEIGLYNMFGTARGLNLMRSIEAFKYKTAGGDVAKGWGALERLRGEFDAKKISGVSTRAAEDFRASPTGIAKQFQNTQVMFEAAIGRALFEPFSESLLKLTHAFNAFTEWVDKHQDVATFIAQLGIAFTALATGLGLVLIVAGGSFLMLSSLLGMFASINAIGVIAGTGMTLGAMISAAAPFILGALALLVGIAGVLGTIGGLIAVAFGSDNIIDAFNHKLEQAKMIFSGLAEMWSDYTTPEELFVKMREAGVWPFVRAILMLKYRLEQLWDGIVIGTALVRDQLKNVTSVLMNDIASLFGTGGLEFTDAEKWKVVGFVIGKVLSALFIGAILFVFALVKVVEMLKEIKAEFDKHSEIYTAMAYIMGGLLVLAVLGLASVMVLFGLTVLAVTWPFLALTLLAMKFWSFMTGDIGFNYDKGFLGYLSAVANTIRDMILLMISAMRLANNFGNFMYGFATGDAEYGLKYLERGEQNVNNIGGLLDRMADRRANLLAPEDPYTGLQYAQTLPYREKATAQMFSATRNGAITAGDRALKSARSLAGYLQTSAMSQEENASYTKNITIQKIEVVAPADISDPDAWAKSLASGFRNELELMSE